MAWLASAFSSIRARCPKKVRRRDLVMDESGGWLVMLRMSVFLTTKVVPATVQDSSQAFRAIAHYERSETPGRHTHAPVAVESILAACVVLTYVRLAVIDIL